MNLWKVIVATLAIFITGVITGGLLVSYADRASQKSRRPAQRESARSQPNVGPVAANPSPRTGPSFPNRLLPRSLSVEFLQKLDAEVQLTSGQRERIEQIIAEGQSHNKQIWERVSPEIRRENIETQRRLRDVLTEEQRRVFDELMKQPRSNPRRTEETLSTSPRSRDAQRRPQRDSSESTATP